MQNQLYRWCTAAVFALFAANASATVIVGTFTGGDVGEGLDMEGNFSYAVNMRGPGGMTVGDALFTDDSAAGISWGAQYEIANWHGANYGSSSNDDSLENVMRSIRWSGYPSAVTVDLAGLIVGESYKLQLLFAESCCNRGFDVFLEGLLELDGFNVQANQGGINNTAQGVVLTYEYVAADTDLNIRLIGDLTYPDSNPILNGLTLEQVTEVPEPSTLALFALGFLSAGYARKKRS